MKERAVSNERRKISNSFLFDLPRLSLHCQTSEGKPPRNEFAAALTVREAPTLHTFPSGKTIEQHERYFYHRYSVVLFRESLGSASALKEEVFEFTWSGR